MNRLFQLAHKGLEQGGRDALYPWPLPSASCCYLTSSLGMPTNSCHWLLISLLFFILSFWFPSIYQEDLTRISTRKMAARNSLSSDWKCSKRRRNSRWCLGGATQSTDRSVGLCALLPLGGMHPAVQRVDTFSLSSSLLWALSWHTGTHPIYK